MTTPTIALVVDDMLVAKSYGQALVGRGLETVVITSVEDVKRYGSLASVDVVVRDAVLSPELEQSIEKIVPSAPSVIFLSSFGDEADIKEAKQQGANGFITKAATTPGEFVDKVLTIITK